MSTRPRAAVSALVALVTLLGATSCGAFAESFTTAEPEPRLDERKSYLEQSGPQSTVDLGGGEEQLLTRFQAVLDEKNALQRREHDLQAEVEALRGSLRTEQERCAQEQRLRVGAEAEAERLRLTKGDRELKILHLQLQLAELQRSTLQGEIAGVERQIDQLSQQAAQPAAPLGTGR